MIGTTFWTVRVPRPAFTRQRYRSTGLQYDSMRRRVGAQEPSSVDESSGPMRRSLLSSPYDGEIASIALPTLSVGILGPLCTAVDTAVAGQLGPRQLSGLGVGAAVFMFVANLFLFVQFLVTPTVSRLYACREIEQLSKTMAASIRLSSICGCLCGLAVFFLSNVIINGVPFSVLGPPVQVREFAVTYIRIMATSIPPYVLYQSLTGILRGLRRTTSIFIAGGVATVMNIVLDFLFVFGFGWGVSGAAFATSFSTYVSTGIMLYTVFKSGYLKLPDLFTTGVSEKGDAEASVLGDSIALIIRTLTLLRLVHIIDGSCAESVMVVCSGVMMSKRGPIMHSAYEVCRIIFLMAHVIYTAFDITMQTLCATYIGQSNREAARDVLIRTIQVVFGVTTVVSGGLLLWRDGFIRLFTSNVDVIEAFRSIAWIALAPIPIAGVAAVIDGSLLGAARFKFCAAVQFLVGALSLGSLFLFHQRQMLTLASVVIIVRLGLSSQILFSWWPAFMVEYKKRQNL